MPRPTVPNSPLVLIVRDGWGENPDPEHDKFNAVRLARTPVSDRLRGEWPSTLVRTSGEEVGLADGTMGNSEVGHQNIGAGRIVDQEILRITKAIRDDSFFYNPSLKGALDHTARTDGCLHLLGLTSDGKVHSDIEHLFALMEMTARHRFPGDRVFIHVITDGRDTPPKSALGFVRQIEEKIAETGVGRIATVMGRYYAMDRDHRWGRVALAYACLTGSPMMHRSPEVEGLSVRPAVSAEEAIGNYYDNPIDSSRSGDEFIIPTRIRMEEKETWEGNIRSGDAVIFYNYRGDRPRELTKAFTTSDRQWSAVRDGGFDRGTPLKDLYFCTMSSYETGLPVHIAFDRPPRMHNILAQSIAAHRLAQFRCAETEKFPHVTFFFNDYREEPYHGERRLLVPSPKDVATYDQKPEMSAYGVCNGVLQRLASDECEPFVVVNFANGDMVGHTGNLQATIRAIEVVDECVGLLVKAALARGGSLLITSDHGNAEQMWIPEQDCPHTQHTTYDVPLAVVGEAFRGANLRRSARLADIAPTIMAMLELDLPEEMSGRSLLNGAAEVEEAPARAASTPA
ncbi:MAG: 2,3-bisphosphoglycerate-independent phosphoglycerate mutase [Phycisphaerales bacterium]|nr:MAG: 2,3-bisphosphoglycerate-independent phosphoglycerate mutase [Phycisphaerales bacterium]